MHICMYVYQTFIHNLLSYPADQGPLLHMYYINPKCLHSWCTEMPSFNICRLLPLYFPRNKSEEEMARSKLPQDVGDENGETNISERRIRITALPVPLTSFPSYIPSINDQEANGNDTQIASTRSLLSGYA